LLLDGLRKFSSAARSFAKRAFLVTFEGVIPLLGEMIAVAALLMSLAAITILPILACVWLWQQITN